MDHGSDIREFLASRRARITPRQAGLPARPGRPRIGASLRRVLDAMTEAPAFIRNGRLDVLAANRLRRALYSPLYAGPVRP